MASKRFFNTFSSQVQRWTVKKYSAAPELMFIRHAGHAKWQNIAAQKKASDTKRSRNASAVISKVRAAIRLGGGTDPKTNLQLASVLEEAKQKEVGKSVHDFLKNVQNRGDLKQISVIFRGPSNSMLVVCGMTDKTVVFRNDLVSSARKNILGFKEEKNAGSASSHFTERAEVIVRALDDTEGTELSLERAEELAIESEAEEVEEHNDTDLGAYFKFITRKEDMYKVKNSLEDLGVIVEDFSVVFHPNILVDLDDTQKERITKFLRLAGEIDGFENAFVNVTGLT